MSIDSTLSRRTTTEQEVIPKTRFVSIVLPWLIAAGALAIYLITLNRWVSLGSLLQAAKLSGWTWQPDLSEPLYWLLTYPLRWLPSNAIPLALNLLSAVCAVLTLALLARSVALLPHDRTHEQRQREHGEFSLLSIRAAWLPPVLAAVICGLQLTFWEHATAASGDMLNLLLFAYVIRCVLEFRIDERESWLTRAALVYGLGMTNNWAMIGFFPLFLGALVWIRGLSFFQSWFPRPHVSIRPDWPLALSAVAGRAKPGGHLDHSLLDRPQSKPGHSGRHPRHVVQEEQTNSRLTGAHFFGASFVYWHPLGFVLWGHQQTGGGARHNDGSLGERVLSRCRHVGHPGSTLQPAEYGFGT